MLTDPQKTWLNELTGSSAEQKKVDARHQRKQAVIAKIISDRQKANATLKEGASVQVSKGSEKSLMKTVDEVNHDQTTVFDLDEERDGYRLAKASGQIEEWDPATGSQEEFQKHLAAARQVDEMVRQLESEMVDGDPLFTPEEIAAEVYQPLMRQGLLSETSVPDKYSQTKKMLDGSFDAYAKRLELDKKSTAKRLFDENFALGKSLVNFIATESSVGIQSESLKSAKADDLVSKASPGENIQSWRENLGLQAKDDGSWAGDLDKAGAGMNIVGQSLTFIFDDAIDGGKDLSDQLGGTELSDDEKKALQVARLAPLVVAGVSSELGKVFNANNRGLGVAASASFGTKCNAKLVAAQLRIRPFTAVQVSAISNLLANALSDTIKALDPAVSGTTPGVTKLASDVQSAMAGQPADPAAVVTACEAADAGALQQLFAQGAATALTGVSLADFDTPAAQDRAKRKASDLMTEDFSSVRDDPPEDDPKGDESLDIFVGALDRRIAQLDRDQAILKWAVNVVNMGLDTATNFIAPLAIAGCAVKMMKNVYEAGCRTRDTYVFCQKRQGMFNAASSYSSAVSQFIYNGGMQATHYQLNAAFECAKMIGAILQCAGPFTAPAGAIVTAAASGTQALEQFLYECKKRYDLTAAWEAYKLALSRPANRKLGLIALKKNPTLAKYSVAWGALIEKDVLVADFMSACGLTAETLKDPDAELDKVVSYLEKRMPDDNVVTGRTVKSVAGWAPSTVELSAASWLAVKQRAETKGGLAVVSTRELELLLHRTATDWEPLKAKAEAKPSSTLSADERNAYMALLKELIGELRSTPYELADGSGPSTEMLNTLDGFIDQADERLTLVKAWATV
ncbi:hypothetical protein KAK06_07565 [Ideonella sp. 4Y11]|uniref:Uncharacterized protein n=1 Tax=Ideonella aquatica TaxID=2824119 RepID=A0A941BJF2_9BURK|nr:hypothetical protein [Ideonella aquatica]MBQ0958813.1 hypothetical protein [Ideonella aquatica]